MMDYNPISPERDAELIERIGRVTRSADYAIIRCIIEYGRRREDGTYQIRTDDLALVARCLPQTVYKRVRVMQRKGQLRRLSDDRRRPRDEDRGKPGPGAVYEVLV